MGLRALSDDRPLVDEGAPVRVTPSAMESALRCSLRWLLERHGGSGPTSTAQGVGNLVHAAAMLAEDASADRGALLDYVAARFDAIELAARWMAGPERERAEAMVDKLLRWLATNPRRLLAIEHEFAVRLDDPQRPVDLTGRVDRLEVDEAGRLVVIDLKTGKSTAVTGSELAEHPQLGAYQAAVEAGAFTEFGDESGGAALVQLGTSAKDAREQNQPAAGEGPAAGWATALVRRTADTMAAATFAAVANSKCRVCPVRTSCPVSGRGARWSSRRPSDVRRIHDPAHPVRRGPRADASAGGLRAPVHPGGAGQTAAAAGTHPGTGRDHRRSGGAAARGGGGRVRQDRDDGRAGGLAGGQLVRAPGADPRADLHPQGGRRTGPPGPHPARPADPPPRPAGPRPAGRPARR